ncbi:hypothetical protein [Helicobacter canis]|uniref:hypothetical protein n=1 Tax=Helicobacter canis TaxID=29419 RepID=UPI002942D243|nr:hypothetical protein [Helicobacter canis]
MSLVFSSQFLESFGCGLGVGFSKETCRLRAGLESTFDTRRFLSLRDLREQVVAIHKSGF